MADTVVVDARDEHAVDAFVDSVAERAGAIDISFNLIAYGDVQTPLMEISVDDFIQPIATAVRTQFLTTRAAARHMIGHGSGVILLFGDRDPRPFPRWEGSRSPSMRSKGCAGNGRANSVATVSGSSR